jgi:hypothetical protein
MCEVCISLNICINVEELFLLKRKKAFTSYRFEAKKESEKVEQNFSSEQAKRIQFRFILLISKNFFLAKRAQPGRDCGKRSISSLGPWRSIFIYQLNMQFFCNNLISVSACYNNMNSHLLLQ